MIARYFGQFNRSRKDNWVFGSHESGAYLIKFAWTKIVRHPMVRGTSSPDDPTLTQYWKQRRSKQPPPPMNRQILRLLKMQGGQCSWCSDVLLYDVVQPQNPQEWEMWLRATGTALAMQVVVHNEHGKPDRNEQRLVHADCQRRSSTGQQQRH